MLSNLASWMSPFKDDILTDETWSRVRPILLELLPNVEEDRLRSLAAKYYNEGLKEFDYINLQRDLVKLFDNWGNRDAEGNITDGEIKLITRVPSKKFKPNDPYEFHIRTAEGTFLRKVGRNANAIGIYDISNLILKIDYLINPELERKFLNKKSEFASEGKNSDELLLFYATDVHELNDILKTNFFIKKDGVLPFSEIPPISLGPDFRLILCRILPGKVLSDVGIWTYSAYDSFSVSEETAMLNSDSVDSTGTVYYGFGSYDQILPYCVIHLNRQLPKSLSEAISKSNNLSNSEISKCGICSKDSNCVKCRFFRDQIKSDLKSICNRKEFCLPCDTVSKLQECQCGDGICLQCKFKIVNKIIVKADKSGLCQICSKMDLPLVVNCGIRVCRDCENFMLHLPVQVEEGTCQNGNQCEKKMFLHCVKCKYSKLIRLGFDINPICIICYQDVSFKKMNVFGISACKMCNDFFQNIRHETFSISRYCKKSNCNFYPNLTKCSACYLAKCVKAGMKVEEVSRMFVLSDITVQRMQNHVTQALLFRNAKKVECKKKTEKEIKELSKTVEESRQEIKSHEDEAEKMTNEISQLLLEIQHLKNPLAEEMKIQFDIFKSLRNQGFLSEDEQIQLEIVQNSLLELKQKVKLVLLERSDCQRLEDQDIVNGRENDSSDEEENKNFFKVYP